MEAVATHRFPLLVGVRAYRLLASVPGVALFVCAAGLLLNTVAPDLPRAAGVLHGAGKVIAVFALAACISPLALLIGASFILRRARRAFAARACDLLCDGKGFRVVGGNAHGYSARFDELDPSAGVGLTTDGLKVARKDGLTLTVPAIDPDEAASLRAVSSMLQATASARAQAGHVERRDPPNLLRCANCGAPLALALRSLAALCPHCGSETPLPPSLAARFDAAHRLERQHQRDEALCRSLIRQPGARIANAVAFFGGVSAILLAYLSAMLCGAFLLIDGRESGMPRLGWLALALVGVAFVLLAFVRRILAARRALTVLTLGFSAIPPDATNAAYSCRNCGAPLPNLDTTTQALLTRCAYCDSENLRVTDLRTHAALLQQFSRGAESPWQVLSGMQSVRRRAIWLGVTGALLLVVAACWSWLEPKPPASSSITVTIPFAAAKVTARSELIRRTEHVKELVTRATLPGRIQGLVATASGAPTVIVESTHGARLVPDPSGPIQPEQLRAAASLIGADHYDRRSASTPFLVADEGSVRCLRADGSALPLYGDSPWSDALIVALSAGSDCSAYVTTRAHREGHFHVRQVSASGSREFRADAREAALSPDGRRLAMTVLDARERFQLAVFPAADPAQGQLITRGEGHVALPVWSPDGKRIAFLSDTVRDPMQFQERYGSVHLYVTDLAGKIVALTAGGNLERVRPLWTEQGLFAVAAVGIGRRSTWQLLHLVLRDEVP